MPLQQMGMGGVPIQHVGVPMQQYGGQVYEDTQGMVPQMAPQVLAPQQVQQQVQQNARLHKQACETPWASMCCGCSPRNVGQGTCGCCVTSGCAHRWPLVVNMVLLPMSAMLTGQGLNEDSNGIVATYVVIYICLVLAIVTRAALACSMCLSDRASQRCCLRIPTIMTSMLFAFIAWCVQWAEVTYKPYGPVCTYYGCDDDLSSTEGNGWTITSQILLSVVLVGYAAEVHTMTKTPNQAGDGDDALLPV